MCFSFVSPLFPPKLTNLLKQSCCNKLCTRAPSMAGSRLCEWKVLRLAQMGNKVSAFPLMAAGVSESSSKGRYVSSTPFSTVTYCLSELSILHQSRYNLLEHGWRQKQSLSSSIHHFSLISVWPFANVYNIHVSLDTTTHLWAVEPALSVPVSLSVLPSSTCCRGDPVWSTTSLLLTSTPRISTPPPAPPPHPGIAAAMPVVITGSASARLPSQDMGELRLTPPTGDSAGLGVAVPLRGARRAWRSKLGWRFLGGLGGSGVSVGWKEMDINTGLQ